MDFLLQCHENMEIKKKTEEGLGIEYDEDIVCEICRSVNKFDNSHSHLCHEPCPV